MKVLCLGARFVAGTREEKVHVHSGRVAGEGLLWIIRFGLLCVEWHRADEAGDGTESESKTAPR